MPLAPAALAASTRVGSPGLMRPLTRWVLNRAVGESKAFARNGKTLKVAVNVSARNLNDGQILDDVADALLTHDMPAERLQLEVIERLTGEPDLPEVVGTLLAAVNVAGTRMSDQTVAFLGGAAGCYYLGAVAVVDPVLDVDGAAGDGGAAGVGVVGEPARVQRRGGRDAADCRGAVEGIDDAVPVDVFVGKVADSIRIKVPAADAVGPSRAVCALGDSFTPAPASS